MGIVLKTAMCTLPRKPLWNGSGTEELQIHSTILEPTILFQNRMCAFIVHTGQFPAASVNGVYRKTRKSCCIINRVKRAVKMTTHESNSTQYE